MKLDPATIERLKQKIAVYREFLKNWLEPSNLAQLRPKLEFQTGVLAGFALIASVLLGVTNCSTEGTIQRRLDEDLKKSLEEVVPAALYDNDMLQDTLTIPSAEYNIGQTKPRFISPKNPAKSAPYALSLPHLTAIPAQST